MITVPITGYGYQWGDPIELHEEKEVEDFKKHLGFLYNEARLRDKVLIVRIWSLAESETTYKKAQ